MRITVNHLLKKKKEKKDLLIKKRYKFRAIPRFVEGRGERRSRPFDNVLKGTIVGREDVGWINYDVIRQGRGQKQKMAMRRDWENNKDFLIVP